MTADGGDSFVESNKDELNSLAEAIAESKGAAIAATGSALLVKVLTGSSIAAGAAEKAAAEVFGHWLADIPDAHLQRSADVLRKADQNPEALRAFALLVEPLIVFGLQSIHATALRIEDGQAPSLLAPRADDLEARLGQALRAIAMLEVGQAELRGLIQHAKRASIVRASHASETVAATGAITPMPSFPVAEAASTLDKVDFFVSYTIADEHWAEWIAWALEACGYTVKLQKWDFGPGTNFVLEMHAAASQAARTIAVLSPAYFASKYGQAEWAVAFREDPVGEARKLVPVRVAECKPSGLLGSIVYIDLYGREEEQARQVLLRAVQGGRGKPTSAPTFPGPKVPKSVSTSPRPAFPGASPAGWMMPFRSNRFFTARDPSIADVPTPTARLREPVAGQYELERNVRTRTSWPSVFNIVARSVTYGIRRRRPRARLVAGLVLSALASSYAFLPARTVESPEPTPRVAFSKCVHTELSKRKLAAPQRAPTIARAFDVATSPELVSAEQAEGTVQAHSTTAEYEVALVCAQRSGREIEQTASAPFASPEAHALKAVVVKAGGLLAADIAARSADTTRDNEYVSHMQNDRAPETSIQSHRSSCERRRIADLDRCDAYIGADNKDCRSQATRRYEACRRKP